MNIPLLSSILQVVSTSVSNVIDSVGEHMTCFEMESTLWNRVTHDSEDGVVRCVSCNSIIENKSELGLVLKIEGKSHPVCRGFNCIDEAYLDLLPAN